MTEDKFINPRRFYSALTAIVISMPCIVLVGWEFNIDSFKSVLPQLIAMNPFTAVLFIFSGIALTLIRENNSAKFKWIGKSIGLAIMIISIIKLCGFINDVNIGFDQILYANELKGNKMAPNTVVCFLLTGFGLFQVDNKKIRKYNLSQVVALVALIIGLLAIVGYIYASRSLYRLTGHIPMALHTAFTFVALTMAIIISRYKTGFVSVVMHKNIGGVIIRRLLPFTIAIPICITWLRLQGSKLNLYDPEFGSAMAVVFIISTFSIIIWWISGSLNKTDEERKRTEKNLHKAKDELAANEVLYRNLIENSGVVMYTTSLDGRITFASSKGFQLTGYKLEELKGKRFTEFITEDSMQMVKEKYKTQLIDNINETILEFSINTKQGDIKWVEQSAVLITENSIPVGFQCIIKDTTERKKMASVVSKYEIELIRNQQRLQSILDNATSLMYIKDLDGKYLLTNKQFKQALKVDDNILGKTDFDFSDQKQAKRFKDTDDKVIQTGKAVELEEVIDMADGKHNILIIKFPLLDSQNKIYGISGIATDITERVRYQEQLIEARKIAEDAKKLQEQFLANMSHEIRTPMNGIQGMTDLLLETELNVEQKEFTKTIKRSSDNLLVIINDILDFSKIQAGKLTIEKIDFDLNEVLDNIKAIFKHRINEKNLDLQVKVEDDVPSTFNGDPFRLNQILINLVGNAIKFTHSGGININISIQNKTNKEIILKFSISDTGIGIPSDKINEVFESFTQATVGTSRKYGGTGLGLAITKQLLEMQNGNISVESKINYGTTFTVSIPYNYSNSTAPAGFIGKGLKNYRSLLNGKRFLIAEDNEVNQKVIRHVLQKAGGTVDIANNGLEAIAFLKKDNDYNLIIMDLQMPEMDGYAATKYIRNVMNLHIPIIAMTASALKGEKSKCIEAGMNDYLTKPFDFAFLYKKITTLLNDNPLPYTIPLTDISFGEKLFDLSLLKEMEDKEYMADILTIFLEDTPKELNRLHVACNSENFENVYQSAHKLKSSTGLLKINKMLATLIKIEQAAKSEQCNTLAPMAELVNTEYKKVEKRLQDHLKHIRQEPGIAV